MESKRRMDTSWREKRNPYDLLRWAKEWLTGPVLEQVTLAGRKIMEDTVMGVVEDIVGTIVQTSQEISASRMDRLAKQARKNQDYQDRMRRLENAEKARNKLLKDLEEIWSFLEDGMPEMETDLEPHSKEEETRYRKRRRKLTKGEKKRAREMNEYRELGENMAGWVVDQVVEQVAVEHNCQGSAACPAWLCCWSEEYRRIEEKLEKITSRIET